MRNTTKERFDYHPDPNELLAGKSGKSSLRRVEARKKAIQSLVDLENKSLLDLGCSGGYFGFSLAESISNYFGLDGDQELIVRNEAIARRAGLNHIHFEYGQITPKRIQKLPHFDVALFLSVFHHIITASEAYDWNKQNSWRPIEILAAIAEKVDVIIFETGYPDEGHEWCERLPGMLPTPQAWVKTTLLEAGFVKVDIISAPAQRGIRGQLRSWLAKELYGTDRNNNLAKRVVKRLLQIDPRDGRDIFVAYT